MIELTEGQKHCFNETIKWFKDVESKQIWEIAGYAGTGKSTIVRYIIDELGLRDDEVAYATYTGKASLVLTLKGCTATTIHKLIYDPITDEVPVLSEEKDQLYDDEGDECYTSKLGFKKKENLDNPNLKLIVLDECSMINDKMLDDIKSLNIPIIVLGDTFQLGPIFGKPVLLQNPDILLTEVMRQKEGDPIVYLATQVRNSKELIIGNYDKSHVLSRSVMDDDLEFGNTDFSNIMSKSDIIICRTNKSRNLINTHFRRKILEIDRDFPIENDKLICRKNNWDIGLTDEYTLNMVNGLIGYVCSPILNQDIFDTSSSMYIDFKPDICNEDFFQRIPVSIIPFLSNLSDNRRKILESKQWKIFKKRKIMCNLFEYAYAITAHLSQGSSWRKCLIYDEHYGPDIDYRKSLYTSITRAEKQVIICKQEYNSWY